MRAVIQRTLSPSTVEINNLITGKIDKGLVVLLGIEDSDMPEDIEWLAKKIVGLRIFNDEEGKMNLSVNDIEGGLMIISQFTLYANTKKGNRPSFIKAAKPEYAQKMYELFIHHIKENYKLEIATGEFAADMKIQLINDGPVTIILDSKNKEL